MDKRALLVKELYEKYPYPNPKIGDKEKLKNYSSWVPKIFGKTDLFWKGKSVLELGCGTGEFANSIALHGAKVEGIDFSKSSIKTANNTSEKYKTKAKFTVKNILDFDGKRKFDVVIALGSLHHTIDARKGFEIAAMHTKKSGYVVVGLYNKYGRFRHRSRRFLLWALYGNDIDGRIRFGKKWFEGDKSESWLADKYGQVHESYHSVREVLQWFDEEGIEFIASKPEFEKPVLDEIGWFFEEKGAFFVMIGKKK